MWPVYIYIFFIIILFSESVTDSVRHISRFSLKLLPYFTDLVLSFRLLNYISNTHVLYLVPKY